MFQKLMISLALITFSVAAVACDRGGSAKEIAGIPASTQVSALSAEQSDAFCSHLQTSLKKAQEDDSIRKAGCLLGGVMMAAFSGAEGEEAAAACQSTYDECMAEEQEEAEVGDEMCPDADDRASCEATVEEVATCMEAMVEYGFGALRELGSRSCADLTGEDGMGEVEKAMENLQKLGEGIPDIEACAPVQEKCPGLM